MAKVLVLRKIEEPNVIGAWSYCADDAPLVDIREGYDPDVWEMAKIDFLPEDMIKEKP